MVIFSNCKRKLTVYFILKYFIGFLFLDQNRLGNVCTLLVCLWVLFFHKINKLEALFLFVKATKLLQVFWITLSYHRSSVLLIIILFVFNSYNFVSILNFSILIINDVWLLGFSFVNHVLSYFYIFFINVVSFRTKFCHVIDYIIIVIVRRLKMLHHIFGNNAFFTFTLFW